MRVLLVVLLIFALGIAPGQSLSAVESEVWKREVKYWDTRNAGQIEEYMSLWHDDFTGWPSRVDRPGGKGVIREGMTTEVANTQPGSSKVKLEPLSVRVYGEVAVVFYRAHAVRVTRSGERVESRSRITHTWKRSAGEWKIIAGMSAVESVK